MCMTPYRLADGQSVECRGCSVCIENRKTDLVGRCLAEAFKASFSVAVTLTYAGDGPETAVLRYDDIQRFLKRLRKSYRVRYLCAGEYGTLKGRAHWHIVLFFYGNAPNVQFDWRVNWPFWPHGYAYFQKPDFAGFRYIVKYAIKSEVAKNTDGFARALAMSKRPPLGHDFFMDLADDIAAQSLPLHSPEYAFADVRDKSGVPRKFWLRGRMRELFIARYVETYWRVHNCAPPDSEYLNERYFDVIARREREAERVRTVGLAEQLRPYVVPPPAQIGWLCLPADPRAVMVAWDNGTAQITMDGEQWTLENASAESVARQLRRVNLPRRYHPPALAWLQSQWGGFLPSVSPIRRGCPVPPMRR